MLLSKLGMTPIEHQSALQPCFTLQDAVWAVAESLLMHHAMVLMGQQIHKLLLEGQDRGCEAVCGVQWVACPVLQKHKLQEVLPGYVVLY